MAKTVKIKRGYFANRVGEYLGRSVLSDMVLVRFTDNCFVLSFTEDNVEVL